MRATAGSCASSVGVTAAVHYGYIIPVWMGRIFQELNHHLVVDVLIKNQLFLVPCDTLWQTNMKLKFTIEIAAGLPTRNGFHASLPKGRFQCLENHAGKLGQFFTQARCLEPMGHRPMKNHDPKHYQLINHHQH